MAGGKTEALMTVRAPRTAVPASAQSTAAALSTASTLRIAAAFPVAAVRAIIAITLAAALGLSACGGDRLEFAPWTAPLPEGTEIKEYPGVPVAGRDGHRIELIEDLVIGGRNDDPNYSFSGRARPGGRRRGTNLRPRWRQLPRAGFQRGRGVPADPGKPRGRFGAARATVEYRRGRRSRRGQ